MRPIGRCILPDDVPFMARAVRARIRKNRENTGGCSYLLACPEGWVYVLTDHSTNATLMKENVSWLVGCYGLVQTESGKPARWPSVAEIADALQQQMSDYAEATAGMIEG